jgi:hypothetical protein
MQFLTPARSFLLSRNFLISEAMLAGDESRMPPSRSNMADTLAARGNLIRISRANLSRFSDGQEMRIELQLAMLSSML